MKVGDKRLSGISFTHDGKAAIVAQRDENGASVLSVDGRTVALTKERISTGVNPYAVDVSSDGRWAVIGNTGTSRTVDDADVVTLVDVSRRPFRAVQQISVPATPEGIAISPDGRWIGVSSMAGSNLLASDPGRHKLGVVSLFEIRTAGPQGRRAARRRSRARRRVQPGQRDDDRAVRRREGARALRDPRRQAGRHRRAHQARAGPVSIRSMPR